jgi:hypothetical protein
MEKTNMGMKNLHRMVKSRRIRLEVYGGGNTCICLCILIKKVKGKSNVEDISADGSIILSIY